MGRHRKQTPAGNARRQLAIAGVGVVAVGGVLSSQLSGPAEFTTNHATGGPTDIPNILSADGNVLGNGAIGNSAVGRNAAGSGATHGSGSAPRGAQDAKGQRVASPDVVDTADTTDTTGATGTANITPAVGQPVGAYPATGTVDDRPAGDALAMLAHSPNKKAAPQPTTGTDSATEVADTDGSQAPEDAAPPAKTDHSIPDRLGDTTTEPQQPTANDDHRSQGLVEHLVGSLANLDVTDATTPSDDTAPSDGSTAVQPPHDTALPTLSGQLDG